MSFKTTQCLFDWNTFYEKKCGSKFPPSLCYPEFYAIAMISILNNYETILLNNNNSPGPFIDALESLCVEYFKSIQRTIDLIFGLRITVKSPEEIHEIVTNYVLERNLSDTSIFFLETILNDHDSVVNYRTTLLETSLRYYRMDSVSQFANHLKSKNACQSCEEIEETPPSSCHYVSYLSNATRIPLIGPERWGPVYWIIFHAMVENLPLNITPTYLRTINDFVAILPFIVPCGQCQHHYYQLVRPGEIPDYYDVKSLVLLYRKIHALVTRDIERIRARSSGNAH